MATTLPAARHDAQRTWQPTGESGRFTLTYGAAAGLLAAAVGLAMLSAITVLMWATGPESSGRSADPFRTAGALWVLGQRGAVAFPGTDVRLAPLGLAVGFAIVAAKAAGWATRAAGAHDLTSAARVVGGFSAAGGVVAYGVASTTANHDLHVGLWSALSSVVPFAAVCAAAGAAPQTVEWARFAAPRRKRWVPVLRSAARAAVVLFAGGAVVVALSLCLRTARTGEEFAAVGGGFTGAVGSMLLSLAFLPTAACWAVGFAAGPGFALGTDASVALNGVQTGALPTLPILGAVPGSGGLPWYGWLPPLMVIFAGVVAGWHRPTGFVRVRTVVRSAATAGALAGIGVGAVLAFSSGDAGGRLSTLGPNGLLVGAVLVGELGAVATATALLRHLTSPRIPDPDAPVVPAPRVAVEETVEQVPDDGVVRAIRVLVDDPDRWAHLLSDSRDLEDTIEMPVLRPDLIEHLRDSGIEGRWRAAKAALAAAEAAPKAPEPEVPLGEEHPEALVAHARLSAELIAP
ncbi:MAG: cell division protein PerM [Sporichthyaceae bacterium]